MGQRNGPLPPYGWKDMNVEIVKEMTTYYPRILLGRKILGLLQCFITFPVSVSSSCVRQHTQELPAKQSEYFLVNFIIIISLDCQSCLKSKSLYLSTFVSVCHSVHPFIHPLSGFHHLNSYRLSKVQLSYVYSILIVRWSSWAFPCLTQSNISFKWYLT